MISYVAECKAFALDIPEM